MLVTKTERLAIQLNRALLAEDPLYSYLFSCLMALIAEGNTVGLKAAEQVFTKHLEIEPLAVDCWPAAEIQSTKEAPANDLQPTGNGIK